MLLTLLLHGDAAASTGLFGYDAPRLHAVINDFPPALQSAPAESKGKEAKK